MEKITEFRNTLAVPIHKLSIDSLVQEVCLCPEYFEDIYRLTYDEKQYFKKILIVLIFLADVAALAVFSSGFFRYSVCVMLGIILTSALHLLRVLQQFFAKTELMNGESR